MEQNSKKIELSRFKTVKDIVFQLEEGQKALAEQCVFIIIDPCEKTINRFVELLEQWQVLFAKIIELNPDENTENVSKFMEVLNGFKLVISQNNWFLLLDIINYDLKEIIKRVK
jgi:hypothetical protein